MSLLRSLCFLGRYSTQISLLAELGGQSRWYENPNGISSISLGLRHVLLWVSAPNISSTLNGLVLAQGQSLRTDTNPSPILPLQPDPIFDRIHSIYRMQLSILFIMLILSTPTRDAVVLS